MGLYKNRKGIVHSLCDTDPKTVKWLDEKQITLLTDEEAKAYAASRGVKAPKKAKSVVTGAGGTTPEDKPKTATQLLQEEYTEKFAEAPDPTWNAATLKKKLKEAAPE